MADKKPRTDDLVSRDDDGQTRRRYVVGARKIRRAARDVSGPVLRNPRARYRDIMSSDDDDQVQLGDPVTFDAWLTDAEAEAFRNASNVRFVEADILTPPALVTIPTASTMSWMGASLTQQGPYTGSGVKVAVIDGGTTDAVRAQCPWTVAAERIFPAGLPAGTRTMGTHGCLVTPEAVPPAGQLIECMVAAFSDGSAYQSDMAAGIVWACDQGAKVCNVSFGTLGGGLLQAFVDACVYARDRGVQVTISAGNDGATDIASPATAARLLGNVHAIGAVRESDSSIATFSNRNADLAGVLPGVGCLSLAPDGTTVTWNGTSSSAPKAALLIALLSTGGTYTPQQAANALRASARDLGLGEAVQGRGAWHLANALDSLADSARPRPEDLVRRTKTARQPIPNNTPTRVSFPVVRETSTDVTANAANDLFTVQRAGKYLVVAGCRWQNAATGPGERYFGIGNEIDWTQPGSKRPQANCGPGAATPLHHNVAHVQRYAVGDKIAAWAWHNSGYTQWDIDYKVGHDDNEATTLSITRLGD